MMKRYVRNLFILCLFLPLPLWGTSGFPTGKQYFFQQIPMQSGLSSAVTSVQVCAEKGCVWVGTRAGIGRYDGYLSKTYLKESISQLLEDRNHIPWAVSDRVFRYDELKDDFFLVKDSAGNSIPANSLCLWKDGILFGGIGTLYKYSYEDESVRLLYTIRPDSNFWMSELIPWDEHTLLAVQKLGRAVLIDMRTGESRPAPFDSNRIMTAMIDSEDHVWVSLYNRGMQCFDKSGKLLHSYDTGNSELKTDIVLSLCERDGQIWAGTDGSGITVIDPEQDSSYTLQQVPGDYYSLPARSILCLYKDTGGGLWAGGVRDGLINIKEVNMRTFKDVPLGQTNGLSDKVVLSLYQDEDDRLWIGTDGAGLNHYDARTGKFHHIKLGKSGKVASVTGFDSENLLVSLFAEGVFFFNKQTRALRPLTIVNDSIDNALCRSGLAVNLFQNTPETVLLLGDVPYCYHIKEKSFIPIQLG